MRKDQECDGQDEELARQAGGEMAQGSTAILVDGSHKYTDVLTDGYVGPGGAHHHYSIVKKVEQTVLMEITFQDGPIKEVGEVNGVMNEDLLAVVIDRLEGFQSGQYASSYNRRALEFCQSALRVLKQRTAEREARGVEGTHKV